jgi:hypothetical protein
MLRREDAITVNVLDAAPLYSERLGYINLGTLDRLGDLEGWKDN